MSGKIADFCRRCCGTHRALALEVYPQKGDGGRRSQHVSEDAKAGRWLWLTVQDKLPEYRLDIDMTAKPWATARVTQKRF
eukprot:3088873-Amphidinium_carterae.2